MESINEKTAYLMLNLMEGVTDFGTAVRLRYRYNFTAQIAAKTGTTQNHSDGWFIGITPKLVAGGWVGAEDRSVHFDVWTWDRVLPWHCPSMLYSCKKYMLINPWE